MEKLGFKTTSYRFGENYQIDLVVSKKDDGGTITDIWIGHYPDGAMKLYMFGLRDEKIGEVIKIVDEHLSKDNPFTSGLDAVDEFSKEETLFL